MLPYLNPYIVASGNVRQQFLQFTGLLHYNLSKVGAPYPPLGETTEQGVKHNGGVAYHSRVKNALWVKGETPWFAKTRWAQTRAQEAKEDGREPPNYADWAILYVIFWPFFLFQARYDVAPDTVEAPDLRPLAHSLLYLLRELVREYDYALYEMLERYQAAFVKQLPRSRELMQNFFGEQDRRDKVRFNAHLTALLQTREFTDYVKATMETAYQAVLAKGEMQRLPLCPHRLGRGEKHRRGETCDSCKNIRWLRRVTLLHPERLTARVFSSRYVLDIQKPETTAEVKDPWYQETRYILSLVTPDEGIARLVPPWGQGNYVLLDFKRIVEESVRYRPGSLLANFGKGDAELYDAGYRAKQAFEMFHAKRIYGHRFKPLGELVKAQGWEWKDILESPYEMYMVSSLLKKGDNAQRLLTAAKKIPKKQREAMVTEPVKPRVAVVEYPSLQQGTVPIFLFQRKFKDRRLTYYTVPYNVSVAEEGAHNRRGFSVTREGRIFWSVHGINYHAEMTIKEGREKVYPLAQEFAQWVAQLDQSIGGSRKTFLKMWRESTYEQRLAEHRRGERQHLGNFTQLEDEALRQFLHHREVGRKRLTEEEWTGLRMCVPGRGDHAILNRIEVLGKEYARGVGWLAYAKSPWCLHTDVRRRRLWLKEGIPLERT